MINSLFSYFLRRPTLDPFKLKSLTADTAIRIGFTLCRGCTLYPHVKDFFCQHQSVNERFPIMIFG